MSETNNIRNQYIADGVIDNFFFDFNIFKEEYLEIYLNSEKQNNGYDILSFTENGGEIKFEIAPQNGTIVTLVRNVDIKRTSDFQEGGAFRASVINNEFDYQIACLKQLKDESNRSMILPPFANNVDLSLPNPSSGKAIIWNENADGLENSSIDVGELNSSLEKAISASEELSDAKDIAVDAVNKIQFTDAPEARAYLRRNSDNTGYENIGNWDLFPILYQSKNSVLETIPTNWELQYGQLANKIDYPELYDKLVEENLLISDADWVAKKQYHKFSDGVGFDYSYSYLPQLDVENDKGYLIEASSEPYSERNKVNAFNYKTVVASDHWQAATNVLPAWISLKSPISKKVTSYAIKTDSANVFPVSWEFRAYRKDGSYEVLDSQSNHAEVTYYVGKIDNHELFEKFMIYVTKFNSAYNLTRLSLEIYGEEIEIGKINIVPNLTSENQNGYIVTASNQHTNDVLKAYRMFDNKYEEGSCWQTIDVIEAWAAIELPEAKKVSSYKLFHRNYNLDNNLHGFERVPVTWDLLGSNDGIVWDVLDSKYSVIWEEYVPQIFDIDNPQSYKHYKIDVKANNGSSVTAIGKLELFEDISVSEKFRFPDLRNEINSYIPIIKVKD